MRSGWIVAAACVAVIGACGGEYQATEESDGVVTDLTEEQLAGKADWGRTLPHRVLHFRPPSWVGRRVVRRTFYSAGHFRSYFGVDAPSGIDFRRELAVFYSAGVKSTGGYRADILGVRQYGARIAVTTRQESPGYGCILPAGATKPTVLVAFPRPTGTFDDIRYWRSDRMVDCVASPCRTTYCGAGRYCRVSYGRAQCVWYPTCASTFCARGYVCEDVTLVCLPNQECGPPSSPTCRAAGFELPPPSCSAVSCAHGYHCEERPTICFPDGTCPAAVPECVPDQVLSFPS